MSSYGDIDHYKPKSVVEEILTEGEENEDLFTVSGRTFKKSCQYGYWWLAYDWDNYLLSCTLCNQPWKRALFPLSAPRTQNPELVSQYPHKSPEISDRETPLLLNPYSDIDISLHLSYTEIGLIKPHNSSDHGRQTIITCGLDRPSLYQQRASIAQQAMKSINRFADADTGSGRERELVEDILDLGNEKSQFPGMVRVMFARYSGRFTWADLEKYLN